MRLSLWLILVLAVLVISIDLPKIPINYQIGPVRIDSIGGYNVDLTFAGNRIYRDLSLRRGLDLQGGVHLALATDMQKIPVEDRDNALESAKAVLERRVNFFGVSEAAVQSSKVGEEYRVLVELPGVENVDEAIALVGKTAQLEFRESSTSAQTATSAASLLQPDGASPSAFTELFGDTWVTLETTKSTGLSGADLKRAEPQIDQRSGKWVIALEFSPEGAKKFADITQRNVNKPLAMFLDSEPLMNPAPVIQPELAGDPSGRAVITGNFSAERAREIAIQLRAGALPVPISVVEQRQVGATLGNESVQKSVVAGAIGLGTLFVFMILYYGRWGLIASIALLLYALTTLAIFKLLPVTLTLAGVAGFILSIGMAVDANILVFERMKEELRWGKGKASALEFGFQRAWSSIRDSNVSSLITTFILFNFGSGLVRGFALTLAIGILVSMFTALTVTKTLLKAFLRVL